MPPKSKWWSYFSIVDPKLKTAKCRTCGEVKKTSGNTSNLKSHITTSHPHLLTQTLSANTSDHDIAIESVAKKPRLTKSRKCTEQGAVSVLLAEEKLDDPQPSTSHKVGDPDPLPPNVSQMLIKDAFEAIVNVKEGGKKNNELKNALIMFFCKASIPFVVVENQAFKNLMKVAVPNFIPPSRKTLKKWIYEKYDFTKEVVKRKFAQVTSFTVTTDTWTEGQQTQSYLGTTVHFEEGNELKSIVLGVIPLTDKHTGVYIAQKIIGLLQNWDLKHENVLLAVTDGASNMRVAMETAFGEKRHATCFAHALNLVAFRSIEASPQILQLIEKVKNLVKFFKKSTVAADELRKQQEGKVSLKLKQSVDTRWNSVFYMIQRYLTLLAPISSVVLCNTAAPPITTATENLILQDVLELLGPLEAATRDVSADQHLTISFAIPVATKLFKKINGTSTATEEGMKVKMSMIGQVKKRLLPFENNPIFAKATLLDPRFKMLYFNSAEVAGKVVADVKNIMKSAQESCSPTHAGSSSDSDSVEGSGLQTLFNDHEKVVQKSWKKRVENACSGMPDELTLYLRKPAEENMKINPLKYWHDARLSFPTMSPIAIKYLSSVCTSVPAERLFSKAGSIITKQRNRLTPESLDRLLFLASLAEEYF